MGPETLEQSGMGPYPGAPYSNEDMSLTLELHTIHSGASPSQAPTHQVPVPTPRNRQEYHGNDATHVWGVWVLWLLTHHTMPSILDADCNCTYSAFFVAQWLSSAILSLLTLNGKSIQIWNGWTYKFIVAGVTYPPHSPSYIVQSLHLPNFRTCLLHALN